MFIKPIKADASGFYAFNSKGASSIRFSSNLSKGLCVDTFVTTPISLLIQQVRRRADEIYNLAMSNGKYSVVSDAKPFMKEMYSDTEGHALIIQKFFNDMQDCMTIIDPKTNKMIKYVQYDTESDRISREILYYPDSNEVLSEVKYRYSGDPSP